MMIDNISQERVDKEWAYEYGDVIPYLGFTRNLVEKYCIGDYTMLVVQFEVSHNTIYTK